MQTKRHHFSVEMKQGRLDAFVPDEGGHEKALDRVRNDDPCWLGDVEYHGTVDWFERIVFRHEPHRKTA
jgi:hypothetical protein